MNFNATVYHDLKSNSFSVVVWTEFGDLIKVELLKTEDQGAVLLLHVQFDYLPAPLFTMGIFRSGFLFAASSNSSPMQVETGLGREAPVAVQFNSFRKRDDRITGLLH